ncbi:MAG: hypothetical protein ACI92W_003154, partial [Paraglaciecola sp.]
MQISLRSTVLFFCLIGIITSLLAQEPDANKMEFENYDPTSTLEVSRHLPIASKFPF